MWAAILAALGPLVEPILRALGLGDILVTDRRTEAAKVRPAVVVRQPRVEPVASGRASVDAMRARRGGASGIVLLAVLGPLLGCSVLERTTERTEIVPTIIDAGPPLASGAKVATNRPTLVVVFGGDGKPVAGAGPVEMDLSGAVVVPPWRWAELMRTEAALLAALERLPPDAESAVLEVLGRR